MQANQAIVDTLPISGDLYDLMCAEFYRVYADVPEVVYGAILPAGAQSGRTVCTHGTGTFIYPAEPGDVAVPANNVVKLDEWSVWGYGFRSTVKIFAGQCPECGRVHWSLVAPAKV